MIFIAQIKYCRNNRSKQYWTSIRKPKIKMCKAITTTITMYYRTANTAYVIIDPDINKKSIQQIAQKCLKPVYKRKQPLTIHMCFRSLKRHIKCIDMEYIKGFQRNLPTFSYCTNCQKYQAKYSDSQIMFWLD